ncbi:MAG: CoA transferase [Actinomycetota bacterium]|nr:CoA transferase [Actinomycetota bacterium]
MTTGARSGPLVGIRVVELTGIGPAPFAAMLLADLGADVIRIDRPGGNAMASAPPPYDVLTRGRPSVAVDLKRPRGVQLVLDLVAGADVLLEGFRPGVTERLGVGPDECSAVNPALVYGRMTGWGQHGPMAQTAGHDLTFIALTGALGAIGEAGRPPQPPLNLVGDFGGGAMYLVAGVLAALLEVRQSGRGQVVDACVVDGTAHLTAMVAGELAAGSWRDQRGGNLLDGSTPFYTTYVCADARELAIAPMEPQFWAQFLAGLELAGDPDLPDRADPAQWDALRRVLAARIASRTRAEWLDVFAGSDACVVPVHSLGEAHHDPHLSARGTFVEHGGIMQPAPAPRFSRTPGALTSPPPAAAGADSRTALTAWGIEDVDDLITAGAVHQHQPQP